MAVEEKIGYCRHCHAERRLYRHATNNLLHLCLSIATFGLWLPIWIALSIRIGGWRCEVCGHRVGWSHWAFAPIWAIIIFFSIACLSQWLMLQKQIGDMEQQQAADK